MKRKGNGFRPLSGYLISKLLLNTIFFNQRRSQNGFRPLSGYLISKSDGFELTQNFINYVFPSPLGVSYFQIERCFLLIQ